MTNNVINEYNPQPIFFANLSAPVATATGDGTVVRVPFDACTHNSNLNYDTTLFQFKASIAGKYLLQTVIQLQNFGFGGAVFTEGHINIVTTSATYEFNRINAGQVYTFEPGFPLCVCGAAIVDMNVNDIAYVTAEVSGSTKIVSLYGNASILGTWFSGLLIR